MDRCLDREIGAVVFDHVTRCQYGAVVAGFGAQRGAQEGSAAPDHVGDGRVLVGDVGTTQGIGQQRRHPRRSAVGGAVPVAVLVAGVIPAAVDAVRGNATRHAVLMRGQSSHDGIHAVAARRIAGNFVVDGMRHQLERDHALGPEPERGAPRVRTAVVRGRGVRDRREEGVVAGHPVGVGQRLVERILVVARVQAEEAAAVDACTIELGVAHGLAQRLQETAAEVQGEHGGGAVVQPRLEGGLVRTLVGDRDQRVVLVDDGVQAVLQRVVGFGETGPGGDGVVRCRIVARRRMVRGEWHDLTRPQCAAAEPRGRQGRVDVGFEDVVGGDETAAGDQMPGVCAQCARRPVQAACRAAPFDDQAFRLARVRECDFHLHQRDTHRLPVDAGITAMPPWRQRLHVGRNLDAVVEHAQVRQLRRRDRAAREGHAETRNDRRVHGHHLGGVQIDRDRTGRYGCGKECFDGDDRSHQNQREGAQPGPMPTHDHSPATRFRDAL